MRELPGTNRSRHAIRGRLAEAEASTHSGEQEQNHRFWCLSCSDGSAPFRQS